MHSSIFLTESLTMRTRLYFVCLLSSPLLFSSQEGLDSFASTEFWYVDRSVNRAESQPLQAGGVRSNGSSCADRWWLPTPMVPPGLGLSDEARKHLQHQRECVNQILKAALAVNAQVLSEMSVPTAFTDSLPKVQFTSHSLGKRTHDASMW